MAQINFLMTTLLNGIWQGTFLAAAMWLLLKLLPRLNPTTRFTVLWVTLLAVVGLLLGPFVASPFASRVFSSGALPDSPAIAAANEPTTTALAPVQIQDPGSHCEVRRRALHHILHRFRNRSPGQYRNKRQYPNKSGMLPRQALRLLWLPLSTL